MRQAAPVSTAIPNRALKLCQRADLDSVTKAAMDDDTTITYMPVSEALERLEPGGDLGPKDLEPVRNSSLTLLDDLGLKTLTDWGAKVIFGIVDARWRNERPTIVTSNRNTDQLRKAIGDRIYDRLRDRATTIVLTGPSRRNAAAA